MHNQSTVRSSPSTTNRNLLGAGAAAVKDAIRYCRSTASRTQTNNTIRQRAKDLLTSQRAKAVEYLLSLCTDAADRGAPIESAELPWHIGLALVRVHYRERGLLERPMTSIAEDHHAEEVAQGAMEVAETDFIHHASPSTARKYLAARGAYLRVSSPMESRALAVAAQG